jgi:NOL1/NOP2/fmu family ribosome biogenesis protein
MEENQYQKNLRFIFKNEKNKIMDGLAYYGITQLPYLLIESGKEKIRGYTGNLLMKDLTDLDREIGLELVGMYLFHDYGDNIRISFDAVSALKGKITKNIIELNDEQALEFLKGRDILLTDKDKEKFKNESLGFKIAKHKDELLGSCKLGPERITNYMPKERRLR